MKSIKQSFRNFSRAIVLVGGLSFIGFGNAAAVEFHYTGDDGPGYWGELAGSSACAGSAEDARQSPINIDHVQIDHELKPLNLLINDTTVTMTMMITITITMTTDRHFNRITTTHVA